MDQDSYTQTNPTQVNFRRKKIILAIVAVLAVLGIVLASLSNHVQPKQLKIVSTNPGLQSVATVSPFLKVTFNNSLSTKGIEISGTKVVSSFSVSGETLTLNFKEPFVAGRTYTVTIKKISDSSGGDLQNKQLTFKPKYVSPQNLPKDQTQAILNNQPPTPGSNVSYSGLDDLLDYGITSAQEIDLEQAVAKFDPSVQSVSVNVSSISAVPHDPNSTSDSDSINFTVTIGDTKYTTYTASVSYSDLTILELYLYNTKTGSLIYDSQPINSQS